MIYFHHQTTIQVLPALVILTFLNTRQKFLQPQVNDGDLVLTIYSRIHILPHCDIFNTFRHSCACTDLCTHKVKLLQSQCAPVNPCVFMLLM